MLKVMSSDNQVISANIWFTANAITLLNNYATTDNTIYLNDWDWYKELRGGAICYIVTDIKKVSKSV